MKKKSQKKKSKSKSKSKSTSKDRVTGWRLGMWWPGLELVCEGVGGCRGALKVNVKGKVCGWRFDRVLSGMGVLGFVELGVTRSGSRGEAGSGCVELLEGARRGALEESIGLSRVGG
jgi:hypothetical protein